VSVPGTEESSRWRRAWRPLAVWALALALLVTALGTSCASGGGATPSTTTQRPVATATASATPTATETPLPAPLAPDLSAPIAYLEDPYTGVVYLSRHADQPVAMASTTKIMTALVAITYGKLDAPVTIGYDATPDAVRQINAQASLAFLRQGDKLTLRDLLYALLLPSGDDAAVAVADAVAGSQEAFVARMNAEAAILGLDHTRYADVHGLDAPGHYTTARELAILAAAAMRSPTFAQVVATPVYTLPANADHGPYTWTTTNELLLDGSYPGLTGVKTGFTGDAGHCLVFAAERSYGHLLGVVLDDGDDPARFDDAVAMLNWGFEQQLAVAQLWPSFPHTNAP
jgi:serine-type D-Ala-D-Ala carboxypeptidase (penicillin-binding protein 5/6)